MKNPWFVYVIDNNQAVFIAVVESQQDAELLCHDNMEYEFLHLTASGRLIREVHAPIDTGR